MKQVCPLYRVQFRNGIILATDRQTDKGRSVVCSFVLPLLPQSIYRRGLTEDSSGGTRLFASSWQGQEIHAA